MLRQIHWQDKKNLEKIDFKMQREINSVAGMEQFIHEAKHSFPLPEDKQYLVVDEGSKYFMMTMKEAD